MPGHDTRWSFLFSGPLKALAIVPPPDRDAQERELSFRQAKLVLRRKGADAYLYRYHPPKLELEKNKLGRREQSRSNLWRRPMLQITVRGSGNNLLRPDQTAPWSYQKPAEWLDQWADVDSPLDRNRRPLVAACFYSAGNAQSSMIAHRRACDAYPHESSPCDASY